MLLPYPLTDLAYDLSAVSLVLFNLIDVERFWHISAKTPLQTAQKLKQIGLGAFSKHSNLPE